MRAVALCIVVNGCDSHPTAPPPVVEPDVRLFVASNVQNQIDPNGHFIVQNPSVTSSFAVIDEARAKVLAVALVRTFAWPDQPIGTALGQALELQHGAPIDVQRLQIREPVILALSPYEDAPVGSPPYARNRAGPFFLVRLVESERPTISLVVGAYTTDIQVTNGTAVLPNESGNDFSAYGNRVDSTYINPIGPERAAIVAARETGSLVAAVPKLLLPDHRFSFTFARWKVTLDGQVNFANAKTGAVVASSVVYVGTYFNDQGSFVSNSALFLPASAQPDADTVSVDPLQVLQRKPNYPLAFDRVVALR